MKMRILGGAVLMLGSFLATAGAQTIQVEPTNRTIAVTASDTATQDANAAVVHIGFKVYAADAQAAYAEGSKASNAIAAAIPALGIPKQNIESDSQGLAEVQPYENQNLTPEEKQQRRYSVQQSWSVKVSAADVAKTLDAAVKAGANDSGHIDWTVNDENALQAQAAGKALERARAIAEQMAKGLGAQLGSLLYASNEAPARPVLPMANRMATQGVAAGRTSKMTVAPLSVNPKRVECSATVYAVFAIQ